MEIRLSTILPRCIERWLLAFIIVLVTSLLPHSVSRAATPNVQLEITPTVVKLAPDETTEVLVVLRNLTSSWLQDIQLRLFTDTDVVVQSKPLASVRLPPDGTLSWSVRITQTITGRTTGTVYFQLHYTKPSTNASQTVADVAVGKLDIQPRPPEAVDQMAEVRVEAAFDEIQEQRSEMIFLVLRNISSVPLTIDKILSYQPEFIQLTIPKLEKDEDKVLEPQAFRTFGITVTLTNRAHTGKQRILLEVPLKWVKLGRTGSGSLLVPYTVNVSILGESELLKLLGVPSLLFLPGFLMFSTILMLSKRVFLPWEKLKVEFGAHEFALISISLSLIAALIYPKITKVFLVEERSYLKGYGLIDIFLVWFGSVAMGIIAWSATTCYRVSWDIYRQHRHAKQEAQRQAEIARRTPNEDDNPIKILEKMSLNDVKFPLEQAKAGQNSPAQCFIILPAAKDRPAVWVAPPILVRQVGEAPRPGLWFDRLKKAAENNPDALAKALANTPSGWEVGWGVAGPIAHPSPIGEEKVKRLEKLPPRLFIEIE